MCLAVPGRVLSVEGETATVDFRGNRMDVCTILTPDVSPNNWVLVHAGFSITSLDEAAARETWEYLGAMGGGAARAGENVESNDG